MKREITYITLGCRVNQAESEGLAAFGNRGDCGLPGDGPSSICIVNTCAVTSKAAMQSRQAIRKAVRSHPGALIVVTGCYAESDRETIGQIEGVDIVIGQSEKHRLFDIIAARCNRSHPPSPPIGMPVREMKKFAQMPAPAYGSRTRPFLKIQDGCSAFCTYCIVPYTRGPNRSLEPDQVVSEFSSLVSKGAHEIVLTGIHLGRYGQDLATHITLTELLKQLTASSPSVRIRLSSLESAEITDELISLIKDSGQICPHFHVPLQSGDPTILSRMHRPYTPESYNEVIGKIAGHFPEAAIGADVLIGFPGESDEAFTNTYNLVESLPITYLHVFPFSPRSPAPAASFPDQVSPPVVKDRCRIMQELGKKKRNLFFKKMIGKTLDVIVEKRSENIPFDVKGLSSNYIPVYIENAEHIPVNTRLECQVIQVSENLVKAVPKDKTWIPAPCRWNPV